MEIIDNMETTDNKKELELMCSNRYCYVAKTLQLVPLDMEPRCHNCGFDLKPWKPAKK